MFVAKPKPLVPGRLWCEWEEDSDGAWQTTCGEAFVFPIGGGPEAHRMPYCCFCGKPILAVPYQEPIFPDEDD